MVDSSNKKRVIFIVGPTAIGKTAVAMEIAHHLDAEIISADSRQIYKYLDIGTAKPNVEDLQQIKHWFVNELEPDEPFSAGRFGARGREVIKDIHARGKVAIVAGGSGLYIRALIDGFFEGDVKDERVREALRKRIELEGMDSLYRDLEKVDPEGAKKIHPNDQQRILRLMEIYLITKKTLSQLQKNMTPPADFDPVMYGMIMPREMLYQRINKRVDAMIENGLMAEVANLQVMGYLPSQNALKTVGYRELFEYFEGDRRFEDMVDEIKKNTRRYAKRQITWFKADTRITWFDVSNKDDSLALVKQILDNYRD